VCFVLEAADLFSSVFVLREIKLCLVLKSQPKNNYFRKRWGSTPLQNRAKWNGADILTSALMTTPSSYTRRGLKVMVPVSGNSFQMVGA